MTTVNPVLAAVCGLLVFVGLCFVFELIARYLVRKFGGSPAAIQRGAVELVRVCPRCDSSCVGELPSDGVSPFPGYLCQGCGLRMRPHGTSIFYSIVLALSVGLAACFAVLSWTTGEGYLVPFPFMVVVAVYSVRQLLRPTPRLSRTLPFSPRRESAEKPT